MTRAETSKTGLLRSLARRLAFDRALAYAVLGRCWSVGAGAVSLLLVGRYLSTVEQGFYYTFWNVLSLWVFFDFGLSSVITQFASHERATLRLVDGRAVGDDAARARLGALIRHSARWYGGAGVLMVLLVGPAGMLFFGRHQATADAVDWLAPWLLLVATAAVNLLLTPFSAILEGSGFIADVSLMRLFQGLISTTLLWGALALGARLYSAVALSAAMALVATAWMTRRHLAFFADLWTYPARGDALRWRDEVWPFQWKSATTWMAGYFMFQALGPILFAARGPEAAGQLGMSLMVTTAISAFSLAWIVTRSVDFGSLVASGRFRDLDRSFSSSLSRSTLVLVALSSLVYVVLHALRVLRHPLPSRLLPPLPLAILMVATALHHVVGAEALYLRAFKREAFLAVFLGMAALALSLGAALAGPYGAVGLLLGLVTSVLVVGLGCGTAVFLRRRREWRVEGTSPAGPS